jgi:hypothetical protein
MSGYIRLPHASAISFFYSKDLADRKAARSRSKCRRRVVREAPPIRCRGELFSIIPPRSCDRSNRDPHARPKTLKAMTEHLQEAYRVDIETRTNADGNQRDFPEGHNVNVHEISTGVVCGDTDVTVSVFPTKAAMSPAGTTRSKHIGQGSNWSRSYNCGAESFSRQLEQGVALSRTHIFQF